RRLSFEPTTKTLARSGNSLDEYQQYQRYEAHLNKLLELLGKSNLLGVDPDLKVSGRLSTWVRSAQAAAGGSIRWGRSQLVDPVLASGHGMAGTLGGVTVGHVEVAFVEVGLDDVVAGVLVAAVAELVGEHARALGPMAPAVADEAEDVVGVLLLVA